MNIKGRHEMENNFRVVDRRAFFKTVSAATVTLPFMSILSCARKNDFSHRIIRVHCREASRPWNYSANAPWDHTVEPKDGQPGKKWSVILTIIMTKRWPRCWTGDLESSLVNHRLKRPGECSCLDSTKKAIFTDISFDIVNVGSNDPVQDRAFKSTTSIESDLRG